MVDVSVILPTYNEKESITKVLLAVVKVLRQERLAGEVLVVDDQSPDGTAKIVKNLAKKYPEIKIIVRTRHHGLGLSIKDGIQAACGPIIIGMDADYNHDPADLPRLVAALKTADLAVASRFIAGGGMDEKRRYYPTLLFNCWLKLLGFPTLDNLSGFYAVKKSTLQKLGLAKIYYGYGDYHLRLVWYARQAGLKIVQISTFYQRRIGGSSKSNLRAMLIDYTKEATRLFLGKYLKNKG